MKKLLTALLLLLPMMAFAANPSLGIHNISTNLGGSVTSYTTASGYTTQTSGSSYTVTVYTANDINTPTVSDTYNTAGHWFLLTMASGTNPIQNANNSLWLYTFVCMHCAGGTNDEVTVSQTSGELYFVGFDEIENTTSLDPSATGYAATGTLTLAVTPTVSGDFLLAVGASGGGASVTASGSGWTGLDSAGDFGTFYLANATTSSQDALASASSQALVGVTIAFKPLVSGGIVIVQQSSLTTASTVGPSGTATASLTGTTAGHMLALFVSYADSAAHGNILANVSDGTNTWGNATSGGDSTSNGRANHTTCSIYSAQNIAGGNVTVTMTNTSTSGTDASWYALLTEWAGAKTSGANDTAGNANAGTPSNNTGPVTVTTGTLSNSGDLALACMNISTSGTGLATPSLWNSLGLGLTGFPAYGFAYILPGATTALSPSYGTLSSSGQWNIATAAYEPAGSSSTSNGQFFLGESLTPDCISLTDEGCAFLASQRVVRLEALAH